MQFTPSVNPATEHFWSMMPFELTPAPGKVRNFDAILPVGAMPSNAVVSYHPELGAPDKWIRSVS